MPAHPFPTDNPQPAPASVPAVTRNRLRSCFQFLPIGLQLILMGVVPKAAALPPETAELQPTPPAQGQSDAAFLHHLLLLGEPLLSPPAPLSIESELPDSSPSLSSPPPLLVPRPPDKSQLLSPSPRFSLPPQSAQLPSDLPVSPLALALTSSTGPNDPLTLGLDQTARHSLLHKQGPLSYALRLRSSLLYDDNLDLSKNNPRGDWQWSLGPQISVLAGQDASRLRLQLDYSGAAVWLQKSPHQQSYQHHAQLQTRLAADQARLLLRASADTTRTPSRDANDRSGQRVYSAGATLGYPITEKLSTEVSSDTTHSGYNTALGSREWRAQGFLNHQSTAKLKLGVGAGLGSLDPDESPSQSFHHALLRAIAEPSPKLTLDAAGGAEWRRYGDQVGESLSPVLSLGSRWQATERTSLSLEGRHRSYASASQRGQNYVSTQIALSASEQWTPALDSTLWLGYEHAAYESTTLNASADRTDRFYLGRASLQWAARRGCELGVFYEFALNDSQGSQANSFQRNRMGVSVNLSF
ncbi:MAG: hypothetical protein RLZZ244_1821 [Verrucomicrobiota bacterium]